MLVFDLPLCYPTIGYEAIDPGFLVAVWRYPLR